MKKYRPSGLRKFDEPQAGQKQYHTKAILIILLTTTNNLKSTQEKRKFITYSKTRSRMSINFSIGTMQARRKWINIAKMLKNSLFYTSVKYVNEGR